MLTPHFLDGILLALAARRDLTAVVDAPRCEMERALKTSRVHDLTGDLLGDASGAPGRLRTVDFASLNDPRGGEEHLTRALLDTAAAHPGAPILLFRGVLSMMTHTDLPGIARSLRSRLGAPVLLLDQPSLDDDWIDGQLQVEATLLKALGHLPSTPEFQDLARGFAPEKPASDHDILISGFLPTRGEGDEQGNLAEMKRLLRLAGFRSPLWPLMCPDPPDPKAAREDRPLRPVRAALLHPAGPWTDALALPTPFGFTQTAAFLRRLAGRTGAESAVEPLIETTRRELFARLSPLIHRTLAGRGAVVAGDPWRAFGLLHALRDLGIGSPLTLLLRRPDAPLPEAESWAGLTDEILLSPDFDEAAERISDLARRGLVEIVVGSGVVADLARDEGLATVETGYPAYLEHFLHDAPTLGFAGFPLLAERLANALRAADHRRRRS